MPGGGQAPPGRGHVPAHLVDQGVDRVEGQLVAQPGDERHPGLLAVEVAGELEQVGLDQQGAVGSVEGGPAADRDRRLPPGPVRPLVPAGVDAGRRQADAVGDLDVGGRVPELGTAPVVTVDHRAPDLMGPPQHGRRLLDLPGGHQAPDPGRRDRLGRASPGAPVSVDSVTPSTAKPAVAPSSAQQGHVPLPPVAEVEVLPHHHQSGAQAVDQDRGHEVLGRLVGPLRGEGHHHRPVDPGRPRAVRASGRGRTGAGGPTPGGPPWPDAGRRSPPPRSGRPAARGPAARPAGPGGPGGPRRRRRWSPPTRRRVERRWTGRSRCPSPWKVTAVAHRPVRRARRRAPGAAGHPADSRTTAGRIRSVSVASYTASSRWRSLTRPQGPSPVIPEGTRSRGRPRATCCCTSRDTTT